jgi:hypothetical protein
MVILKRHSVIEGLTQCNTTLSNIITRRFSLNIMTISLMHLTASEKLSNCADLKGYLLHFNAYNIL